LRLLQQRIGSQAHFALRTELAGLKPGGRTRRSPPVQPVDLPVAHHPGTVQRAIEEVVHHAPVTEAYFVFGRVHVDVDRRRIDFEEQQRSDAGR
jgi:hypothetical protein